MRRFGLLLLCLGSACSQAAVFDVTAFGAKATEDARPRGHQQSGRGRGGGRRGTVNVPPGTYLTGSIQLRSSVTLHIEAGATLEAASDATAYDAAEPNEFSRYQDGGHSHWHNSLIWGDGIENVAITGGGLISGKGLGALAGADKTVAFKLCHNVTIRDVSISNGGHFGILVTGVDNLTIDNIRIDTNRDGMDIDSCRNVRISNSSVNSPDDDAIVFKGTLALGAARPTENVTVTNCLVSGFDVGTLLDGTYKRTLVRAPDRDGPTGRIKIGTESAGDFRNFTISNVVFDRSRGLALEAVDGGHIETSPFRTSPCATCPTRPSSSVWAAGSARRRGPRWAPSGA